MNREQVKELIKERIPCTDYLETAPNYSEHNQTGYCCPFSDCGSGTHGKGSDGAVKYYPETNTWYCHACERGGDTIDAYRAQTGEDYNAALSFLAAEIGETIDNRPAQEPQRAAQGDFLGKKAVNTDEQQNGAEIARNQTADFTEYYRQCARRLREPAAISYLQARGIRPATAAACNIGFDPAADPANVPGATGDEYKPHPTPRIIMPCTKDFYIARSIDPNTPPAFKAPNPKGSRTALFNSKAIYNNAAAVFICEGVFDALSFLEAGQAAIATNGKGNGKLLLEQLQEKPAQTRFIIVPDNDDDPKTAAKTKEQAEELNRNLQAAGYKSIIYNIAGEHHDANDAFIKDRAAFEQRAADAIREAQQLPGLLTAAAAMQILENVDDHYLEMPRFNELSKILKLRRHDTIVIAADTGAGKSSLALNFLYDLQDKYPALYINLEMDEATILQRLVAIHTGMILDRIEGYKHDEKTRADVNRALEQILSRKEIQLLNDTYDLKTIEENIKIATQGREEPTIVFIDTALLITTGNKTASRYERFTHISEELRRISLHNNIILFALLQQNREGKNDKGKNDKEKRPTNSSLKESGSWENDATKIMFLWNYPKEILITKNRSGQSNISINLDYSPLTQYYAEESGGFTPLDDAPAFEEEINLQTVEKEQQQKINDILNAAPCRL